VVCGLLCIPVCLRTAAGQYVGLGDHVGWFGRGGVEGRRGNWDVEAGVGG